MQSTKYNLAICLLLTVIALLAFYRVAGCDFVSFDDRSYVAENVHVRGGLTLGAIRWAFTSGDEANWHPLTWISHMIDVQVFGLKAGWHHAVNVLLHIVNTVLLFLVLRRMTREKWKSAFVAAIFAVHPIHVESVAWVAERKDVLSTLFWLLTLAAYAFYAERPRPAKFLTVLALYALGLMAKPMLVTIPFVLLLLDFWPLRRLRAVSDLGGLVAEKIPFFILAGVSCVVTYIVQQHGGAVSRTGLIPLDARLANALVSYCIYIGKTVWPFNLAVLYPHPGMRPLWQVAGAAIFLAAVSFAIQRTAGKRPYLALGWFWFAGTLVPVIGIVQVGPQALADRYMYIPLVGLLMMAAWGIPESLSGWRGRGKFLAVASALAVACLVCISWRQVGYWRDSLSLYDHALAVTGRNALIYNNRGFIYNEIGREKEALDDFSEAIEIYPKYVMAYSNRGSIYDKRRDYQKAIDDYTRAIELDHTYVDTFYNRGGAYYKTGRYDEATADFQEAVRLDPGYVKAYYNLGLTYGRLGDQRKALENLKKAAQLGHDGARKTLERNGLSWRTP